MTPVLGTKISLKIQKLLPAVKLIAPYLLLSVLIIGPGLAAGYILLLDMPWGPNFHANEQLGSHQLPVTALLWLLSHAVPSWLLQKLVLLSILTAAGTGAHRLANVGLGQHIWPARLTGLLYVLNPYVAERLLAGQWLVLAGYALAPWLTVWAIKVNNAPNNAKNLVGLGLTYMLLAIVSPHWWYALTLIVIAPLAFKQRQLVMTKPKQFIGYILAFMAINSHWMAKLLQNNAGKFSQDDFLTFATRADNDYGLTLNVINLYGFWSDKVFLPKHFFGPWLVVGTTMFVAACTGAFVYWKTQNTKFVPKLLIAATPAILVLCLGHSSWLGRPLIESARHLPGFSGLRDTAKLIGLLALFVSLFAPFALARFSKTRSARVYTLAAALVIISMNGLLFGARGQISSVDYPAGWSEASKLLENTPRNSTIVLPWQGYLNINFAKDVFMANPAKNYFGENVVTSSATNNPLLDNRQSSLDILVRQFPATQVADIPTWLNQLRSNGVERIMLIKTGNWSYYEGLFEGGGGAMLLYEDTDILLLKTP